MTNATHSQLYYLPVVSLLVHVERAGVARGRVRGVVRLHELGAGPEVARHLGEAEGLVEILGAIRIKKAMKIHCLHGSSCCLLLYLPYSQGKYNKTRKEDERESAIPLAKLEESNGWPFLQGCK